MATSGNYYLNGPSLGSASGVFTDAELTICAPDGFYSDGVISRELVNCVLLPQQVCLSCTENEISLQYNATSALDLYCNTSTSVNAYIPLGETFYNTSQLFQTSALLTPLADGFYREFGANIYRENLSGQLQVQQIGPSCPTCFCITVEVRDDLLQSGGEDLYYNSYPCDGSGPVPINLQTTPGTPSGGNTYFGLCVTQFAGLFQYGISGTPFSPDEGINVYSSSTACSVNIDCPPVIP